LKSARFYALFIKILLY